MLVEFTGTLDPNKITVVQYYADWCGPCNMLKPILNRLSEEEEFSKIDFVKINIDNHNDLAKENNITSLPTVVIYKDQKELVRDVGFKPKEKMKEWINKNINNG